jgi:predicted acylesterase/phospholipase RssA
MRRGIGMPGEGNRISLALSGGGFRATLFHLGAVRLLYEAGKLKAVGRISAVSGGSIIAAHLVLKWREYTGNNDSFHDAATGLLRFIQDDIRGKIVRRWIFAWVSVIPRLFLQKAMRWTAPNLLQGYYANLFSNATLKDLGNVGCPDVSLNCTSLSTGAPCFFGPSGFTWHDGREEKFISTHEAPIAFAVAASSAFPPLFPPIAVSSDTLVCSK